MALKPAQMDWQTAAALPTAYLTGYQAYKDHADLRPGQSVLWVANKKLDISNFNFKFPIARQIEIIRYYRQTLQG